MMQTQTDVHLQPVGSSLKVLLIIEQCNPEWPSVPLVGYNFFREIDKRANVTLVTHERNRNAIAAKGHTNVIYMPESELIRGYYRLFAPLVSKVWQLYHTLNYPIYAEFNNNVYNAFKDKVQAGAYDIVHVLTPMMPRYPVKLVRACKEVPFLLGPVNGGVSFPKGFQDVARREFYYLNVIRHLVRLIPGYVETYKRADHILAGSTFTMNMIQEQLHVPDERISLFYENGIDAAFLETTAVDDLSRASDNCIELLFVGRLVPYKGADMLLDAISQLPPEIQQRVHLTIVGDGVERQNLQQQQQQLQLGDRVTFVGWVAQQETLNYYRRADIFCFPSVREFGGAVVLEAMACGLPCIVVNNGGIGEYVTPENGFSIEPISRQYVVNMLQQHITDLVLDQDLRKRLSTQARLRAQEFEWGNKAEQIVREYHRLIEKKLTPRAIQ